MMTPDLFNKGEALSRHNQPHIGDLIRLLSDPNKSVTFVIGAGLGIDAGFPSWSTLIGRIATTLDQYKGIPFGELAMRDTDDLMRKADYLIESLIDKRTYGEPKEVVREMLYSEHPNPTQPGPLAKALAPLFDSLRGRVAVLTTNFEDVIDTVIREDGNSEPHLLDLAHASEVPVIRGAGAIPIVHLHGRLARKAAGDMGKLVLTESDFHISGKDVRSVIADALRSSVTVFLGLSLTDPNLVGSLWDTEDDDREPCFVLTVPPLLSGGIAVDTSRAYGLVKSNYLHERLDLKPIYLKSYSQLAQLLFEFKVALADPESYLSDDEAVSTAYGDRFSRLLDGCYQKLGYDLINNEFGAGPSEGSTSLLAAKVARPASLPSRSRRPSAKKIDEAKTVGELLAEFLTDKETHERLETARHRLSDIHPVEEEFGLFFWLRNRAEDNVSRYSLRLAATSAYQLSSPMNAAFIDLPIESSAIHTAPRALANGKGIFWNVPPEASAGVWKGVATAPIRILEKVETPSGRVVEIPTTVGAVSLYSTHRFEATNEEFVAGDHVSVISALDIEQKRRLLTRLELDGRALVS